MIAHKRFKAISAVVLAAFVAVGSAVPCFASEATADSDGTILEPYFYKSSIMAFTIVTSDGSASGRSVYNVPSAYTITFDSSTGFYSVSIDVASALSLASGKAYINAVYFTIANMEGSTLANYRDVYNYSVDFLDFSYSTTGNGSFSLGTDLSYFPNLHVDTSQINNNFKWYLDKVSVGKLSAFVFSNVSSKSPLIGNASSFRYGVSNVNVSNSFDSITTAFQFGIAGFSAFADGTISFKFRFVINSAVVSLVNAGDNLLNLAEDLSVPTPNIDVESVVENALEGADMESVGEAWSFMSNDLITKMLLIVVSFALLGYILYGKKEASGK